MTPDQVPPPFQPVLERLYADSTALFGARDVRLVPAGFQKRVLSEVLRVAVGHAGDDRPRTHLFVKIFRLRPSQTVEELRARVVRDFETTRWIHESMSRGEGLGTVRPVACHPDHFAIVTEETRGETFGAYVQTRGRWFPGRDARRHLAEAAANVGRWVRAFQAIDPRPGEVSLADLRGYIDVRLARIVHEPLARWTEADRSRALHYIDRLSALVPRADLAEVLVHADLAPGNVLVTDSGIVGLDFAMTRRGNRMHDISRLYVQIEMMCAKPQYQRGTTGLLQQAMLHGFDPDLSDRHPLFRLLLLLHRVNHLNTLSVRRERFPASAYNAHLRRLHRRWIAREVTETPTNGPDTLARDGRS